MEFTILGGGSNVLAADTGVRGLLMRLRVRGLAAVGASGVRAEAGVTLKALRDGARLARTLQHHGATELATVNTRDFAGLGFTRVWNPLAD